MTVAAHASPAHAGPIDDALKRVGPAYMCGPHFEYEEALDALKRELTAVGMADFMVEAAMDSVREVAEGNAETRVKLTAAECAEKYGR